MSSLFLLPSFRRSRPSSSSQPPSYCSWSSYSVGYPVPGLVSTSFPHMYSVPGRSVQRFLQARLHVWHPIHLSRWKTIEICERTFMRYSSLVPLCLALQLMDDHVGVAISGRRAVIVKAITVLRVTSGHQYGLQPHSSDAIGSSTAPVFADWRLGKRDGPFRGMVKDANAARDPGADHGARHDDAIVVVGLHPVVVQDSDVGGVFFIQPERLDSPRQSEHPQVVVVGGMNVPFPVRRDAGQRDGLPNRLAVDNIERVFATDSRFKSGAGLAESPIGLMVEIKVLAAGKRAPRDQALDVHSVAGISPAVVNDARPAGAGQYAARLFAKVGEVIADAAIALRQIHERQSNLTLAFLEAAIGNLAVGLGCKEQDEVRGIHGVDQRGIAMPIPFISRNGLCEFVI